jgi:hypothetical protein
MRKEAPEETQIAAINKEMLGSAAAISQVWKK